MSQTVSEVPDVETDPAGAREAALPAGLVLGYGLGSFGTGVYSTVPSLLLHFFMVNTLGVPSGMAAAAIFGPKLWVVFADPAIGRLSDRAQGRWGRRGPFLLGGALCSGVFFAVLFGAPAFASPWATTAYVALAYLAASTAYSVFAVPYLALPAELTRAPAQLLRITSWRMVFMLGGILIAGGLAPQIVAGFGGGRPGYAAMSFAVGGACTAAMLAAWAATRGREAARPSAPRAPGGVREALADAPFRRLALAYLCQLVGVGAMSGALPYYAIFVAGGGADAVTAMFVALTGAAAVAMPLWARLAARFGRAGCHAAATGLMAAALAAIGLRGAAQGLPELCACMAAAGIGFAGLQLFPFAEVLDIVQADARRTGRFREGLFTGLWTANEKVGLAAGGLIQGAILSAAGFVESTSGGAAQDGAALAGIRIAFSAAPAIVLAASLYLLKRYRAVRGAA